MKYFDQFCAFLESFFNHKALMPPIIETPQPEPIVVAPQPIKVDIIKKWAEAIAHWEGATPYLNNPGNLKYSTLTASWGGIKDRPAGDGGYFCRFITLTKGQQALYNFLKLGCENQLLAFHQSRTLRLFTIKYAGNPPEGYISGVVKMLGVPQDTDISTFL